MGYHTREFERGEYGEVSKIREEWEEFLDAHAQGAKVLALCELADMLGAVAGYVEKHFPGMTLADVQLMADMTRSAFEEGERSTKGDPTAPAVKAEDIHRESWSGEPRGNDPPWYRKVRNP